MKAIKVNADYESVLFYGKSLPAVNETLEFLAFYLDDRPIVTPKVYSPEYLSHVESIVGKRPHTVNSGPYENWWGELKDIHLERILNSKRTSTLVNLSEGWVTELQILSEGQEPKPLIPGRLYMSKELYNMSGRGISRFKGSEVQAAMKSWRGKEVIIEPMLNRKWDFSHYVFENGNVICYENVVDGHFQYKGSIFADIKNPTKENLSFYQSVPGHKWREFDESLSRIISHYRSLGCSKGFSIDSFVYELDGEFFIYPLCEINYRKTMGYVAHEIGKIVSGKASRVALEIRSPLEQSFHERKRLLAEEGRLLLSPDGIRFDVVLKL